ncbi:HIT-like protein [Neocallimastix lanati (nom. inval.)]|uniref:HIT-like protein n=1 Tax=Neocallimastix californiae TaxID=1754190 RepID=A0A1Y2EAM1_9FUNG|nr:HIT-like protein [Neocallimastix sp. JGI-2020a]ORY67905.1 HIT-like protein [Neocallimastix californiae]|eukprot:ORY67905.1 HIT-like protein [Neocallimastix californiae]
MDSNCIFCKIIKQQIPSFKLIETDTVYSFLDIGPLNEGHALIIPKYHCQKVEDVPDEYLHDILPVAKKIAKAIGCTNYNILQNNGRLAHQEVMHVHFHVIPKDESGGLEIKWRVKKLSTDKLKEIHADIISKLE